MTEVIAGVIGGAIVAVLTPLVSQARDRRDVRAEVLRKLAAVERARWMSKDRTHAEFRTAVIDFRAAALVAGAQRSLIDCYLKFAAAARSKSEASWERDPDPEFGGGISTSLASLVRDTAALNVDYLWHPLRRRLFLRRDLRRIEEKRVETDREMSEEHDSVYWAAGDWIT